MRRGLVLLAMFLSLVTVASAQAPPWRQAQVLTFDFFSPTANGNAKPEDVIARMLTFDRDGDGRVALSELPERMQPLIARGDIDHDNALDPLEIQKVAITPPPPPPVLMRGVSHAGGYGFADEDSISSLSHIESSLEDLRLASDVKEQALPIVKAFAEALDADASAKLLQEMESLLTVEQLADFRSAIDPRNPQRVFFINRLGASGANVFMVGPNLARRIEQYGLAGAQKDQALAAIERFKAKLRPGEPDRNVLLDQVKSILSDEERDNFRAALERRPLTKAGGVISGVVGGGVVGGSVFADRPGGSAGTGRPAEMPPRMRPAILVN